jgi:hypothetical protein
MFQIQEGYDPKGSILKPLVIEFIPTFTNIQTSN